MKPRKILLIVLVVLVLAALMYKMSERYVYSNTIPMDVQTLLEQPELAFTEVQKEFLITVFNTKTIPQDPTNIIGTFTQNQNGAIDGVFRNYMPQKTTEPVKKFVPPNVMGFLCNKQPNNNRFLCSFS